MRAVHALRAADDEMVARSGKSYSMTERETRIAALVASHDNHLWVGYAGGRIDRYTAAGKMAWSKVGGRVVGGWAGRRAGGWVGARSVGGRAGGACRSRHI